jgi:peptide/nickel transport system permease protein
VPSAPIRYVSRRLLSLIFVWLGISLLTFGLANLAPGDPALIILQRRSGGAVPTREQLEQLRHQLGLDDPFPVRYARWLARASHGDLGTSYRTGEPVTTMLGERFPATLELALSALLFGLAVALPLGVLSALRRDSAVDHAARLLALVGSSLPSFWLGYVLILVFAVSLGLLPVAGSGDWTHLILPSLTLGLGGVGGLTRLARAKMLDALAEDYVRTARAKGLSQRDVVVRHALRNALNPTVTLAGLWFGRLLAGAVIVETVFAWPGIGKAVVESIFDRDYPMIQGFVLLTGTTFVTLNLLVDLCYLWLDPRVRLTGSPADRGSQR